MRVGAKLIIIGTVIAVATQADQRSTEQADSSLACVDRLELPAYDVIARSARIQGSVTATVLLSPAGSVQSVKSAVNANYDRAKALLVEPVERAIRGSSFRPSCDTRPVVLVFQFTIVGEPKDNPKQSVAFGYPNKFWITAEPHTPQP